MSLDTKRTVEDDDILRSQPRVPSARNVLPEQRAVDQRGLIIFPPPPSMKRLREELGLEENE